MSDDVKKELLKLLQAAQRSSTPTIDPDAMALAVHKAIFAELRKGREGDSIRAVDTTQLVQGLTIGVTSVFFHLFRGMDFDTRVTLSTEMMNSMGKALTLAMVKADLNPGDEE